MAEIRLQMEELRRQLAQRQQFESAKQEQRRNEASKDAFFRVMSKNVNSELLSPSQQQSSSSGGGVLLTRSQDNNALDAQLKQMTNQFAAQMNMGPQDQFLSNRPISQYNAEQQPYDLHVATMGAKIPATTAFQLEGGVGTTISHLMSGEANGRSGMQSQDKTLLDQTYIVGGSNSCAPHIATPNGGSALHLSGSVLVDDITDQDTEMTPEMQAKRSALLANQIRRKERIVAKHEEKELEEMDRQQTKMLRMEQAELRKMEREQRRQKLLEEYKRKKLEQELGEPSTGRMGGCTSSTISLNRGQSQPPFGHPKSQSNMNLVAVSDATTKRLERAQSSVTDNNDENAMPRPIVPSTAELTLKLYARHAPKSNRSLISNALQYSIFPGLVSAGQRTKAQIALGQSDSKHFLVLFRDHRLQYRGLYTWDKFSDTVNKIEGQGPKICKEPMMSIMFKYDSGAKSFGQIQTKHLSATIDGFVIADQYWQKSKIPHSSR